ncbi:YciI family protein [Bartonella sp. DGB1]|uniref:YciI family protein n=1 Tax=Bartonella sp. DGB1 TaxID=3239807 RepID=UPI003525706B
MLFTVIAYDKINHLEKRNELRSKHLEFLESCGEKLKLAGPFLDDEGQPIGSLLIYEVENRAELEQLIKMDPYTEANLFEKIIINPWRLTKNNLN